MNITTTSNPRNDDEFTMKDPLTCSKCNGKMEEGYCLDHGHGNWKKVSIWISGAPEEGFFGNLKTSERPNLAVSTFRCTHCGYLESYARQVEQ